jgi:hypothetical protein
MVGIPVKFVAVIVPLITFASGCKQYIVAVDVYGFVCAEVNAHHSIIVPETARLLVNDKEGIVAPAQIAIVVLGEAFDNVGQGQVAIVVDAVAVQPLGAETVSVYVPAVVTETF